RDIAAITVNRWPHGYGYVANSLYDEDDYEGVLERARQKSGRVAIANSDAGGGASAPPATAGAARAVRGVGGGGSALRRAGAYLPCVAPPRRPWQRAGQFATARMGTLGG